MAPWDGNRYRRERELFGHGLLGARLDAGLSQRALASLAGLNQSTISRLERGTAGGLRYETLMRLLSALGAQRIRVVGTNRWFRPR
jgi:transcriptional regulator with XRE-family HTH domain